MSTMLILEVRHDGTYDESGDWIPLSTFEKQYTDGQWVRFVGMIMAQGYVESANRIGSKVFVRFWPEYLDPALHTHQRSRMIRAANTYAMQDVADADTFLDLMTGIVVRLPESPVAADIARTDPR